MSFCSQVCTRVSVSPPLSAGPLGGPSLESEASLPLPYPGLAHRANLLNQTVSNRTVRQQRFYGSRLWFHPATVQAKVKDCRPQHRGAGKDGCQQGWWISASVAALELEYQDPGTSNNLLAWLQLVLMISRNLQAMREKFNGKEAPPPGNSQNQHFFSTSHFVS